MCDFCDKIYNNDKLREIEFTGRRKLKIRNAIVKDANGKIGLWNECEDIFCSGIIFYPKYCPNCAMTLENREVNVLDASIDKLLNND